MVPLLITIPVSDAFEPGDNAELTLNDVLLVEGIDLVPGYEQSLGHYEGAHYSGYCYGVPPRGRHYEGLH